MDAINLTGIARSFSLSLSLYADCEGSKKIINGTIWAFQFMPVPSRATTGSQQGAISTTTCSIRRFNVVYKFAPCGKQITASVPRSTQH